MSTVDHEVTHRLRVIDGMKSQTFKDIFYGEFDNLRKAIALRDKTEIRECIEALEACAVDACRKYDDCYGELNNEC